MFLCVRLTLASLFLRASGYWLMGANNILTTQRIDPITNPGTVATHVHAVLGGSNFGLNLSTSWLRQSQCTSIPIAEDKSNYWFPQLYFQWRDGSFTSVDGNAVIRSYYLFSDAPNSTTAFPEDFRMLSGDPNLRTLDPASFAQQAITYICLNFDGVSSKHNELPVWKSCPSGIRSQVNFPSCWDGENVDSPDHRSHVAFLSTGPDNGTCNDPQYPYTLPRIFLEVYWITQPFEDHRNEAMTPSQPFVYVYTVFIDVHRTYLHLSFAHGDPTGYGNHADFFNGWDEGALEKAIAHCTCNPYGDPTCCASQGLFTFNQSAQCYISDRFDEVVKGNISVLPGANPVQATCYEEYVDNGTPAVLAPVYTYTTTTQGAALPRGTIVSEAVASNARQIASGRCIRTGSARKNKVVASSYWMSCISLLVVNTFVRGV
uniref:DUF1996 domain-containing protein n=1 Tax=Moniliophthora roreri TaxID=221103 RepID=A0A0W0G435_MONRR